jgi:hypothetical protein
VWFAGFYPGYYLFFLSAPLLQSVEKALGSKVWPRVQAAGPAAAAVYSGLAHLVVPLGLNYLVAPFVALGWDYGITAWASMYYGGACGERLRERWWQGAHAGRDEGGCI